MTPAAPTRGADLSADGAFTSASPVTVRPASSLDVPALTALDVVVFGGDAWPEPTWWAELAGRPRRHYLVAADERGELLAYGGVDISGTTADIMTIGVAPDARGGGLGTRMLHALEAAATERGADAMLLEVRADNDPARRLYDRSGYELLTVRRRYYQPDDVDAHVMRKHLTVLPSTDPTQGASS